MSNPTSDTKKALAFLHGLAHLDPDQDIDIAVLVQPYLSHSSAEVRGLALEQLEGAAEPSLLRTIMELAENDPDVAVRRQALLALGAYIEEIDVTMDMEALELLEEEDFTSDDLADVADLLWSVLEDEEVEESQQQAALIAIASLEDPAVEEAIATAWGFDTPDWRSAALRAMGRSQLGRWGPQVTEALNSTDRDTLIEAIWAAGRTSAESALPRLSDLARTSTDQDVLAETLHALGAFASLDAVKALTDFIAAGKTGDLSETAWWAIEEIKEGLLAARLDATQDMSEDDFALAEAKIEEEVEALVRKRVPARLLAARPALDDEDDSIF